MWFNRKNKIDLFNHSLVSEMDNRIVERLKVDLISTNQEILKQLSDKEIKLSDINYSELLLIYEKFNEELTKFILYTYHQELKIENNNERNTKTLGLSKGFSITYAIYYFFLKNNQNGLLKYLSKRKIPQFEKFNKRLEKYFIQSKVVMLSDSYIQYAGGYNKENVNSEDIDKALEDLQEMDEEHGSFWISMLTEDQERVLVVNKDLNLIIINGEEEFPYQAKNFKDVKSILQLHIEKEFDKIKSFIKK